MGHVDAQRVFLVGVRVGVARAFQAILIGLVDRVGLLQMVALFVLGGWRAFLQSFLLQIELDDLLFELVAHPVDHGHQKVVVEAAYRQDHAQAAVGKVVDRVDELTAVVDLVKAVAEFLRGNKQSQAKDMSI